MADVIQARKTASKPGLQTWAPNIWPQGLYSVHVTLEYTRRWWDRPTTTVDYNSKADVTMQGNLGVRIEDQHKNTKHILLIVEE